MKIEFQIEKSFRGLIDQAALKKAVKQTCQVGASRPAVALSLVITDEATIKELNHQYRGLESATDVLSFPTAPDLDEADLWPAEEAGYLGDIIISYPVAARQAQTVGHTAQEELMLLTVHGTLHLLGFDHDTPTTKATMWQAQQQVMAALGLAHVQPTEQ